MAKAQNQVVYFLFLCIEIYPASDLDSENKIQEIAIKAIQNEIEGVRNLTRFVDADFIKCVQTILDSNARVVMTGIGKSAIIAQKISATLNSTGQASLFMHAADAIHGDLGMIQKNDVLIAISKSGNTPEIVALVPLLKKLKNPFVAMVGNMESYLAKNADMVINTTVEKEACPNNLAPTTSTTAQLIMGDALAIALLSSRNFGSEDFSKYHPGGALGKRLYLTAADISNKHSKPSVTPNIPWNEVIVNITENRLGATVVIENNKILGIITDGDIRRMLGNHDSLPGLTAKDIMSAGPKTITSETMATEAAINMQENKITQLIVVDNQGFYQGLVHLHDLYEEGIL